MRNIKSRREFLGQVGSGMLIAGVGASVAADIGWSSAFALSGPSSFGGNKELSFGKLDALVDMMPNNCSVWLRNAFAQTIKQWPLRQFKFMVMKNTTPSRYST